MNSDLAKEVSTILVGSSLMIVGSLFVLEGGLTWLGWFIFFPMMTGGFGLALTNSIEIMQKAKAINKWRSACLSLQKILPKRMIS
jgi:hypothetical protein